MDKNQYIDSNFDRKWQNIMCKIEKCGMTGIGLGNIKALQFGDKGIEDNYIARSGNAIKYIWCIKYGEGMAWREKHSLKIFKDQLREYYIHGWNRDKEIIDLKNRYRDISIKIQDILDSDQPYNAYIDNYEQIEEYNQMQDTIRSELQILLREKAFVECLCRIFRGKEE